MTCGPHTVRHRRTRLRHLGYLHKDATTLEGT